MCSFYVWLLSLSIVLSKFRPYCSVYQYFLSPMNNIPICAYIPFSLIVSGMWISWDTNPFGTWWIQHWWDFLLRKGHCMSFHTIKDSIAMTHLQGLGIFSVTVIDPFFGWIPGSTGTQGKELSRKEGQSTWSLGQCPQANCGLLSILPIGTVGQESWSVPLRTNANPGYVNSGEPPSLGSLKSWLEALNSPSHSTDKQVDYPRKSCPTLCDPRDCSPLGSPVSGIVLARILEWVAIPFSRVSSWPRDRTWVSCIAGRFFTIFTIWATREAQVL